jgi:hypothetical protein
MVSRSKVSGLTLGAIVDVARRPEFEILSRPWLTRCTGNVVDNVVFAVLTVNEDTGKAERAMWAWKLAGRPESEAEIIRATGPHSPLCRATHGTSPKARNIATFLRRYRENPAQWHMAPGETASQYRDRLLAFNIAGLGMVKTTWAAMLISGGGDVACIDRHMQRVIVGRPLVGKEQDFTTNKAKARYRRMERVIVWLANRYGWDNASDLQWSAWCVLLNAHYTHTECWAEPTPVAMGRAA